MVHNTTTSCTSLWIFLINVFQAFMRKMNNHAHMKTFIENENFMLRWNTGVFMKTKSYCFGMNIAEMHEKFFIRTSIYSLSPHWLSSLKETKLLAGLHGKSSKKVTKSIEKWFCAEQVIFKLYFSILAKMYNEKHMMYTCKREDWAFLNISSVATSIRLQEHLYTLDLYLC